MFVHQEYQTNSLYSFFFTQPFLMLHSLHPDSTVTNLHSSLLLSYSFLLVAG